MAHFVHPGGYFNGGYFISREDAARMNSHYSKDLNYTQKWDEKAQCEVDTTLTFVAKSGAPEIRLYLSADVPLFVLPADEPSWRIPLVVGREYSLRLMSGVSMQYKGYGSTSWASPFFQSSSHRWNDLVVVASLPDGSMPVIGTGTLSLTRTKRFKNPQKMEPHQNDANWWFE